MNRMRMFATSLTLALLTGLMPGGPATVLAADQSSTIQVAQDANLGTILTGPNGMTLYLYTKDTPGVSNCYDRCATNWPPLLLKSGEQPAAPAGLKGTLGTTTRKDGSIQVTFNGGPLYFWNKDKAPGDTTGQNVNSVWFVAEPGLLLDTAGTWSQSSVSAAVRSGWVKADPDGNFHPGRQVSRAEFTAMLGAAFGTPAAGQASPADAQGAITRQEAVGMLVRALGLGAQVSDATTALARFTDGSKLSAESAGLMALAVDKGLLQGYPDGTIHGEATITHAEAVTLILRAMKLKQ